MRFGNFSEGRRVIDEELEQLFMGMKTPKAALDEAVRRGNVLLRRFEAANL
jgi:sn-glycerol 3-phosphate transport system substrate-binding protein